MKYIIDFCNDNAGRTVYDGVLQSQQLVLLLADTRPWLLSLELTRGISTGSLDPRTAPGSPWLI